ncbi:hypothetical protein Ddye_021863 [Dipteronia dyeriana]|uniref:DUF936 domain-containing protein n=1 Tax=Dipteronia dyeriana TaxID=168575 RepID=A0AAD9WXY0_9ROSI|nr:hypothetical protein Ddye_021863 [Dipteronia dyeriana]
MDSLTPGVLSKLLDNVGNSNFKVTGRDNTVLLFFRSARLFRPVNDYPFRTRGFFLKLPGSLHSAYVSISPQDLDLIFSYKIQLGKLCVTGTLLACLLPYMLEEASTLEAVIYWLQYASYIPSKFCFPLL